MARDEHGTVGTALHEVVRVDVLGPLRVTGAGGDDLTPDGALQRRLLALLVLRRGRITTAETAIATLWPDGAPRDPVAALQNHMFRLRRALPDGVIESVGSGYRLAPERIDVDADRLTAALEPGAAREAMPLELLDALLDRWHGPAYPELEDVDDGRIESARLEELRIRAREVRAERRLEAGDTEGLTAELAALIEEAPLRERPRALLMAALAGSGRQVEALRVYDDFRRLLGDDLGIEPSPELASQHAELLTGAGLGRWTPTTRLPIRTTSLVGRDPLVAELLAVLAGQRLLTLVGPGGVGKTRLMVEVGHRLRAADPERAVVMCELATARDDSVADVVARALHVDVRPGVGIVERLAGVVADADLVVLIDNCEHVIDAVARLVDRLLATCPNVVVVCTSRERLRVPGEHVTSVPPLAAAALDAPAVTLFVERARAVAPGFDPTPSELAAIAEIVRRLDGLPLAIELAAARLHTLDVAEVKDGLANRFALLSSGFRTSDRHASLGAAIEWSHDLLAEPLQRTFADVSVFAGSFTVAEAAAICGLDVVAAGEALHQLAERSLVMRAPDRRFVLLETLRVFAADQLARSGRVDVVGERHARRQIEWIEHADRRIADPGSTALLEIDAAIPELRAALAWLLSHGEVELAGRLVIPLLDYGVWRLRPDVLAWAEHVNLADPDDSSPIAAELWAISAYAAWMSGDVPECDRRSRHGMELAERTGIELPSAIARTRGIVDLVTGNLEASADWSRRAGVLAAADVSQRLNAIGTELLALGYAQDPRAEEVARELLAEVGVEPTPCAAYVWFCAGEADLGGDVHRARQRLGTALELAEATHTSFVTGVAGASKASIEARHGDPMVAAAEYRWLVTHWHRAGMWPTQWTMLRSIALLLARLERWRDAAVLVGAVRAADTGHRIFGADEVALSELSQRLERELGEVACAAALADGAAMSGDAAVEHALQAL